VCCAQCHQLCFPVQVRYSRCKAIPEHWLAVWNPVVAAVGHGWCCYLQERVAGRERGLEHQQVAVRGCCGSTQHTSGYLHNTAECQPLWVLILSPCRHCWLPFPACTPAVRVCLAGVAAFCHHADEHPSVSLCAPGLAFCNVATHTRRLTQAVSALCTDSCKGTRRVGLLGHVDASVWLGVCCEKHLDGTRQALQHLAFSVEELCVGTSGLYVPQSVLTSVCGVCRVSRTVREGQQGLCAPAFCERVLFDVECTDLSRHHPRHWFASGHLPTCVCVVLLRPPHHTTTSCVCVTLSDELG
jgi:hypothetical protein